jgi:hypothetical protein
VTPHIGSPTGSHNISSCRDAHAMRTQARLTWVAPVAPGQPIVFGNYQDCIKVRALRVQTVRGQHYGTIAADGRRHRQLTRLVLRDEDPPTTDSALQHLLSPRAANSQPPPRRRTYVFQHRSGRRRLGLGTRLDALSSGCSLGVERGSLMACLLTHRLAGGRGRKDRRPVKATGSR